MGLASLARSSQNARALYIGSAMAGRGDELALCNEAHTRPYALTIVQRRPTLSPEALGPIARTAWESYASLNNGLKN